MIVIGSALMPGERLRWWHVVGASVGLVGVLMLIDGGRRPRKTWPDAAFYLSLIGIAAALWGLYAIVSRSQPDVPTSALGVFYAAAPPRSARRPVAAEDPGFPTGSSEWAAIAGLGILPMGLAIYFWDFGIKRGDIQALGAFSYVEPFIGAVLVALFAPGPSARPALVRPLVVGGAVLASASLWGAIRNRAADNSADGVPVNSRSPAHVARLTFSPGQLLDRPTDALARDPPPTNAPPAMLGPSCMGPGGVRWMIHPKGNRRGCHGSPTLDNRSLQRRKFSAATYAAYQLGEIRRLLEADFQWPRSSR